MKNGKYFKMTLLDEQKAEIYIDGDIVHEDWRWYDSETSAISFRNALVELGDVSELNVHINSPGGDVFEAAAIYNMLKRHKATVTAHIDGLAASAASIIAMAADHVVMPSNSMLMIHNAWTIGMGNHNDFRKQADDLEKINNSVAKQAYLSKSSKLDEAELTRLMDDETWLSANEALEMGLADEVIAAVPVAASLTKEHIARYKNAPAAVTTSPEEPKKAASEPANIDKEYFDGIVQQLQNQIEELKNQKSQPEEPTPEPVKAAGLSAFFLNSK